MKVKTAEEITDDHVASIRDAFRKGCDFAWDSEIFNSTRFGITKCMITAISDVKVSHNDSSIRRHTTGERGFRPHGAKVLKPLGL